MSVKIQHAPAMCFIELLNSVLSTISIRKSRYAIRGEKSILFTLTMQAKEKIAGINMSAPSATNINQLDNPTRTKANHQSGTNPSV